MRILLDTNIVIYREASTVTNKDIGQLFKWLDKLHHDKCLHPITLKEIEKHPDEKVKKTFAIKLQSYHQLKSEAPLHPETIKHCQPLDKNENDVNDTKLLNELICGRVDSFITEDKKIHYKAAILNVQDKVFNIESFLELVISEHPDLIDYKVLSVKKNLFGDINLQDGFFDSFREDYIGFDKWFNRKSDEYAYICKYKENLRAFLYVKFEDKGENYLDITPQFLPKKRLKIGTMKVNLNGLRIGERFLKIVFDNALKFKVEEIYVTIFVKRPEQYRLLNLLEEYGFKLHGTKTTTSGPEQVYVRDFQNKTDYVDPKKCFPFISRKNRVFIVPIYPEYHTELLPDSILRNESPNDFSENEPHRNSISKSYISHSYERGLKKGDIIVFYRTGGYHKSVVTTIGVVEELITELKNEEDLIQKCKKRTVLTDNSLKEYWNRYPRNKPFIVNFLYAYSFPKRINLKRLIEIGVISGIDSAPRGFTEIGWENLNKIIKETNCDESIIVN